MKLKELRENANKNQLEIANILNITQGTYGKYERGDLKIDLMSLTKLADYYGVSLDYLCDHRSNNALDNLNAEDRQAIVDFLALPSTAKAFIRGEIRTAKITAQSFSIKN